MIHTHLRLVAVLLGGAVVVQAVLWFLARSLGRPLSRGAIALGQLLPWLVLGPWIGGPELLVPTGALAGQVPGTPPLAAADEFAILSDTVFQLMPWELEVRHRLAEGRVPLASDLLDGGSDLWSNPQAGVLSPLATLARAAPVQHHFLVVLALAVLVAFQGAWLLARTLGGRPPTATLAGVSFALGGAIFAWALFPLAAVVAWTPWLVAGGVRLARAPRPRTLAATALAAAAVFVSGHPEAAAAAALLAPVAALAARRRRESWLRPLARTAAAGLLGAGLAAAHLVPFALLLPHSQRAREHLEATFAMTEAQLLSPRTWFAEFKGALFFSPASPLAFGTPYREPFSGPIARPVAEAGYTGLAAFLGLAAVPAARSRRRTLPLVAYAAAALLLASEFLPLRAAIQAFPLLRLPEYTRFLPVAALALAVAGALAVQDLLRAPARRRFPVLALAAGASLAVAPRAWAAGLWALLALVLVAAPRRRTLAAAALVGVALLDLGRWSRWHLPAGDAGLFYPSTTCAARVREAASGGPWRVVGQRLLAFPSILPAYGLAEVRPHNPLAPRSQIEVLDAAFGYGPDSRHYIEPFENLGHPLLDFLNVRVVVSNVYLPEVPGMEVVAGAAQGLCRLYRNPQALPRWFLPRRVDRVERADLPAWIRALDDPWRVAVAGDELQRAPGGQAGGEAAPPEVRRVESEAGWVRLALPAGPERLLATSLPGPRGWRATAGGESLRTLAVNGAFLGALLPEGVAEVELRYRPPGLEAGAALSVVSALALAACLRRPSRRDYDRSREKAWRRKSGIARFS